MYTIPTRLARPALSSKSPEEAKKRVLQLYRDYRRGAPEIIRLYTLNCSVGEFRYAVRARFERNRYVNEPRVVDVLLHKSRQEYQEMMNFWKQRDHLLNWMAKSVDSKPQKTFMQQFIEGRDGHASIPAATVM